MKNCRQCCVAGDAVTAPLYITSLRAVDIRSGYHTKDMRISTGYVELQRSLRIRVLLHKKPSSIQTSSHHFRALLGSCNTQKVSRFWFGLELRLPFGSRSWRHDLSLIFPCAGAFGDQCKNFRINIAPTSSKGAAALLAALMVARA